MTVVSPIRNSKLKRAERTAILGMLLTPLLIGFAQAEPGTPAQKRACTPDVYRLCAGEIPNVRAITACLRRNLNNLSEGCRAVFSQ